MLVFNDPKSGMKTPSDQQMVEYKKLHNKLAWKLKAAQTDEDHHNAEQALKRLKTNRNEMLEKFMQDQSLTWISTLGTRNDHETTEGSRAETEDLNKYQLRAALHLDHMEFTDPLLVSEFERIPSSSHPNPTWAEAGEKIYHYSKFKSIYSAMDTTTTGEFSQAAQAVAAPAVENPKTENANVKVNWDKLVNQKHKQCQKKVNKMGEVTGTLMSFEAMCTVLQADDLKAIVSGAHAEVKTKLQDWHLRMATAEPNQEGHDTLKGMLETIDEVSAQTNEIIVDVQGKLADLDKAHKASAASAEKKNMNENILIFLQFGKELRCF